MDFGRKPRNFLNKSNIKNYFIIFKYLQIIGENQLLMTNGDTIGL